MRVPCAVYRLEEQPSGERRHEQSREHHVHHEACEETRPDRHDGPLREFSDKLRSDKAQYFATAGELLDGFRDLCKKADEALPRAFAIAGS